MLLLRALCKHANTFRHLALCSAAEEKNDLPLWHIVIIDILKYKLTVKKFIVMCLKGFSSWNQCPPRFKLKYLVNPSLTFFFRLWLCYSLPNPFYCLSGALCVFAYSATHWVIFLHIFLLVRMWIPWDQRSRIIFFIFCIS